MKYYLLFCVFALISGFVTGKAVAEETDEPDWASKPVICGTVDKISEITRSKGLELTFGGNGLANSVNMDTPASVYVFLGINPETKEWALSEVSDDEACIIGYGTGFSIDAHTMKKLSKPQT